LYRAREKGNEDTRRLIETVSMTEVCMDTKFNLSISLVIRRRRKRKRNREKRLFMR